MTTGSFRAALRAACLFLVLGGIFAPASFGQSDCSGIAPVSHTSLTKVDIATGVPGELLFLASPPGDRDRRFIVDQSGRIYLHKRGDSPSTHTLVADISTKLTSASNEQGLLGFAFDPDFAVSQQFYVNYTESLGSGDTNSIIARYTMDAVDPDLADPTSEVRILQIVQPPFQSNHNGGWIGFGPDGYLYIATGDGGGGGDQHGECGNGQLVSTLLGKLLRIDVRGIAPNPIAPDCDQVVGNYMVPGDNPFAGVAGCDEIWAYGLRNPWRNSFDRVTGDLYLADVGQGCWEELDFAPGTSTGGENYGWRQMEGEHCYQGGAGCDPSNLACARSPDCNDPSLLLPVVEYKNFQGHADGEGCSVTGGYSYQGCRMPNLAGTYFYGDFCSGFVRSFKIQGGIATNPVDWTAQLGAGNSLTSFGEDDEGEIFVVKRGGTVSKILPPLTDFHVSAVGADSFMPHSSADWTWENLAYSSEHNVAGYKVYRGQPGGLFSCIQETTAPDWAGDTATPVSGNLFAYLVTAVNAAGDETHSGVPDRNLDPAACL
jgi:glucose/arabinose dehydrogenase